jgi:hypothetical protein
MKMVIGVIEWSSGKAQEPTVFVSDDVESIRRNVAEYLVPMVGNGEVEEIDREWIEGHPTPNMLDSTAVEEWLDALRDYSTDAWLTIYGDDLRDKIHNAF